MEDLTGQQLGQYQLQERIGRGGMSAVYRAIRAEDQAEVAVKVMDTSPDTRDMFFKRFEQEAKIVSAMRHPNILPLLDYGHDQQHPFMVTPLINGGTLADILRRTTLSPEETGGWLYQVASALDHAHQQGVVHRDLKPTNILLDDKGHAYLTDFGIAKILNITGGLTVTGNVLGTPTYMAPEQWRGEDATPLTDIYGLGVLVYLMLSGEPPFHADSPHSLMYKHLNEPPPPIRIHAADVSEGVEQVVNKALAKNSNDRYPTSGEFSQDFQRALRGMETIAHRHPPRKHSRISTDTPSNLKAISAGGVLTPIYAPAPNTPYPYQASRSYVPVLPPPRPKRGSQIRSCLWVTLIMVALGGFGVYASQDPDRFLPQTLAPELAAPLPTSTPTVSSTPQVRINFPENGADTFTVGVDVSIGLAIDSGVTKLEIRRFGYVVDTIENPSDVITYRPYQAGRHVIEIVPYRGTEPGESAILEIIVR